MTLPEGKDHRTAVVIDVRAGVTKTYRDRYTRLLQSFGGMGISVDVHTLLGNTSGNGPSLVRSSPNVAKPGNHEGPINLAEWATKQGYAMLLVATPTCVDINEDEVNPDEVLDAPLAMDDLEEWANAMIESDLL